MFKPLLMASLMVATSAYADAPDSVTVSKAKAAVAGVMRDPPSVQFRDVRITGNCNGTKYVSGWANGKDESGAYEGFWTFLVRIKGNNAVVMQNGGDAIATDAEFEAADVCERHTRK